MKASRQVSPDLQRWRGGLRGSPPFSLSHALAAVVVYIDYDRKAVQLQLVEAEASAEARGVEHTYDSVRTDSYLPLGAAT